MKKFTVFLCTLALVLGMVGISSATTMTYTDRSLWEPAAGAFSEEDFSSFGSDTLVPRFPDPAPNFLDVGDFTIQVLGASLVDLSSNPLNVVDVSPFITTPDQNVDGTTYYRGGVVNATTRFRLTFDAPITAWGADFENANDGAGLEFLLGNADESVGVDAASQSLLAKNFMNNDGFFGFVTDTAFTQLVIQSGGSGGEGFGMDNVVYSSSAPVPEPATMLLVGSGMVGLAALGRRKIFRKP